MVGLHDQQRWQYRVVLVGVAKRERQEAVMQFGDRIGMAHEAC